MPLPTAPPTLDNQVRAAIIRGHSQAHELLPMEEHYRRMGFYWPPHGNMPMSMTAAELARALGIVERTVRRWAKKQTHGVVQLRVHGPIAIRYSAFVALCVKFRSYAPPIQEEQSCPR